jgi:hypothetical protein
MSNSSTLDPTANDGMEGRIREGRREWAWRWKGRAGGAAWSVCWAGESSALAGLDRGPTDDRDDHAPSSSDGIDDDDNDDPA